MRPLKGLRKTALAVALLCIGTSLSAAAPGRVRGGPIVRERAVVVGPLFYDPLFWDPFWYPRFGWGIYSSYGPAPSYGYPLPPPNAAPVELHVKPRKTTVVVDGTVVGQARDFRSQAYPLWLKNGAHRLEFRYKGYQTLRVKFEVRRGRAYRVHYELNEGEGIDPRSSRSQQPPPEEPGTR